MNSLVTFSSPILSQIQTTSASLNLHFPENYICFCIGILLHHSPVYQAMSKYQLLSSISRFPGHCGTSINKQQIYCLSSTSSTRIISALPNPPSLVHSILVLFDKFTFNFFLSYNFPHSFIFSHHHILFSKPCTILASWSITVALTPLTPSSTKMSIFLLST